MSTVDSGQWTVDKHSSRPMSTVHRPLALGITDGSAGMVAQVRALADVLGVTLEEKTVKVNAPWKIVPNVFLDWGLAKLYPVTDEKWGELPELVISCGRKGALVASSLPSTKHQATSTHLIHIQDPQMSAKHFDVVIAMEHDRISGPNVIKIPYALHNLTLEKLAAARAKWEPKFAHLPRPWNAVLIGGSTNRYHFLLPAMRALIAEIDRIPGSLLITNSRRTGEENSKLLSQHFGGHPERAFIYTGALENPYLGMLACADAMYVTNDSVNMMSEALATGKPVTVLKLLHHENTKPARFAEKLHDIKVTPQQMMKELVVSICTVIPDLIGDPEPNRR